MANEDNPLEITVEDDPVDANTAGPTNASQPAQVASTEVMPRTVSIDVPGFASALDERRLAEASAALRASTDPLRQLHENSSYTRMIDQMRQWDELSGIAQMEKHLQLIGKDSVLTRFSEQFKLIEESSTFARLSESMRLMEENSTVKRLAESLNATGELARAAIGPMWELRAVGLLDATGRDQVESIRRAMGDIESKFRLPAIEETVQLTKLMTGNSISEIAQRWSQEASSITRAIESMNAPWLNIQDKIRSITGMAEMQGLGLALQKVQGFEDQLSEVLRLQLGDWRDPITWRPKFSKTSQFALIFTSASVSIPG